MEQKYNNNDWICKILLEFCELEGEEIAYRKGNQPEAKVTQYGGLPSSLNDV